MSDATLTVATWNTWWATVGTIRGLRIAAGLAATAADIIVVTEGARELLPARGHIVDAGADWGYTNKVPARRKVIVWSRFPLTVETTANEGAACGRLVVSTAATPDGPVRVIGVCIPWTDAHVTTGRRDAQPWSEHLEYLDQLAALLPELDDEVPTVIAGDFNQRIPRVRQPIRIADRLSDVLTGWTVHTAGDHPHGPHIDHIATNARFECLTVTDWPGNNAGEKLSDHSGVRCSLARTTASMERRPSTSFPTVIQSHEPNSNDAEESLTTELTPELRAEIEKLLRANPVRHGEVFRALERGERIDQIVESSAWKKEVFRSVGAMLGGTLPPTKKLALVNSHGYRDLLNHGLSPELRRYVTRMLRRLKEINPEVDIDKPLQTRALPTATHKHPAAVETPCPRCQLVHAGECD